MTDIVERLRTSSQIGRRGQDEAASEIEHLRTLVEGLQRSAWLILRAVAQGGPVHVTRNLVANFDRRRAELVTWTDPTTGAVIFEAVEKVSHPSTDCGDAA
ncbi:hypothetical protein [Bradyrhizobium sp. USDA 4452]